MERDERAVGACEDAGVTGLSRRSEPHGLTSHLTVPSEFLTEIADLAGGLGILLVPLFPLVLPVVGLMLASLMLLRLLAALLALPLVAPPLLARAIMRRRARAVPQERHVPAAVRA